MFLKPRKEIIERDTPAWKLFNYRFPVYVKNMYMEDPTSVHRALRYVSTREEDDQAWAHKEREVNLTIPELSVILMDRTGEIRWIRPDDAVRAYDLILEHLQDLIQRRNAPVSNVAFPPIEDILKLEELAGLIYDQSAVVFIRANIQKNPSELVAAINAMNPWKEQCEVQIENVAEKHSPITTLLTTSLNGKVKTWK